MFQVRIFTRLLRQECGWDEARTEKLTRHLRRLGYHVRHSRRDACELRAEKELAGTYRDPLFWLRELPESLGGFELANIIRRIDVFTDTPVASGGTCHGISKPSGVGFYGFSIGVNGCDNGSIAYLDIKDVEDFSEGLRLFGNQVMMFTVMAEIFKDATQAKKLISENHEFGGALRTLDDIRHRASLWFSVLLT